MLTSRLLSSFMEQILFGWESRGFSRSAYSACLFSTPSVAFQREKGGDRPLPSSPTTTPSFFLRVGMSIRTDIVALEDLTKDGVPVSFLRLVSFLITEPSVDVLLSLPPPSFSSTTQTSILPWVRLHSKEAGISSMRIVVWRSLRKTR